MHRSGKVDKIRTVSDFIAPEGIIQSWRVSPQTNAAKEADSRIMKKRILERKSPGEEWWDLTRRVAEVAVTSENPDYPVDAMLSGAQEWRAAEPGEQTIRLTFDGLQTVRRIFLRFVERDLERTQEFSLCWAGMDQEPFRNLLRQQWTFSPDGATEEVEQYVVDLPHVHAIELTIRPGRPDATASLAELKLA